MIEGNSNIIPLFPLNIVLLPNEKIQLHIFEDRYKRMVRSSIDDDTPFGIILKTKNFKTSIGCTAKVVRIDNEYYTGEIDIVIEGLERFKVHNKYKINGLWHAEVDLISSLPLHNNDDKIVLSSVQEKYIKVLMLSGDNDLSDDIDHSISYNFSSKILLPLSIKQALIETHSEKKRLEILDDLFDRVIDKIDPSEVTKVKN
tara:strand:- start:571 stop:1173 length:603 start_codon:yes stop_codon:yes gene_type:complete